ncbi:hypothetical protein AB9G26_08815 [Francisella philomiragia]|uniref:hypothetical protein n=1 Tax=Francisella philomiragia TaxID=28110 RepID=UPI003511C52F
MKETAQDIMNSPKQTRATKLEQQGYPMKEARHAEEKLYENYNLYIKEVYNSFVRNGASNGNITGMEVYITHAPCRHLDTGSSNNVGPYSCTSKLIEISENMASVLRGPMKVYYDNYFGVASTEKQRAYYYHMVNQAKSNIIIEHSPGYFE